jgi:type I restriction enzyme S subunit
VAKLMPYEEYKKTGLDWIDEIPTHWKIKHTRYLWKERKETNYVEEQLLSVTINKGIVSQSELLSTTAKKDSSNLDKTKYKLVLQNDIAYNKMRMWQGAVGVSKFRGIVSPAYIVLKPIKEINHHYYHYLLRTPNYIGESYRFSYGICDDQLSLRYEDFKGMSIIVPPKEEQDQIAKFLDNRLSKINRFIKAKKKQIELLKELKQAIINQVVTKGIDPSVPMKDSGVEWIGKIPEHWEVTQVGKVYDILLGKMLQPNKENNGDTLQKYICALNVFWDKIALHNIKKMWFSPSEIKKYKLKKGDLIVVEGGDVAVSHIWDGSIDNCFIQNAVHRVREKKLAKNEFLYYWLYSLKKQGYIDLICNKATFAHFTKKKFSRLFLLLPPINEQVEIINYIETKSSVIDKAIDSIQRQIDLVTEYRTSLISAVVTGKVDVRHIPVEDTDEFIEDMDEEEIGEGDKEVLTC